MKFNSANIFMSDFKFHKGSFTVIDGVFTDISCEQYTVADIDFDESYVIPGLIDIHTHGNSGYDFSDGNNLEEMLKYYASNGVTSVALTSMTYPYDKLEYAYKNARIISDNRPAYCSRLAGINMEGPYFSTKKKGAHDSKFLKNPDLKMFNKLYQDSGKLIKIVDIAPELDNAIDFIRNVSEYCTLSIAHSDADYDTACVAINNGVTHLTHTFNAMNGIHHRNPGPICAASENTNVYAELICDGYHVSPSVVRAAFKLFPGRICIISDSLACCGLPDGEYYSGGLPVTLNGGLCRLHDGTLAGSACNVFDGVKNCISYGIEFEEVIKSATINPAKQIRCDSVIGSIEVNKYADFLVCDKDLNLLEVYIDGVKSY